MSVSFRSPLSSLLACLLLLRCQPTTEPDDGPGYDYCPLETGRFIAYDVEEQRYALSTQPVRKAYQLKEVIGAAYADVTGQPAYRLLRYRRPADGQPWQPDSIWSVRLVNNELIRSENGRDFVKLVFPVDNRLIWNGNRHNAADTDEYETRNAGQPYRVLEKQFAQTVTVVGQDDSTLVSQDKRVEVYARQVGLIYKEQTQLQFCQSTPDCIGTNKIEYGIRKIYRIRTYGTE